ncbi:hypothetical protein ADUPG1_000593 [Aduncisulcus paluster]|uniref:Gustatory receptor n=1 Tax=Aduncisulcus paluster TaxID=2918883 RepID=A0ABQ5K700_9EUKA|nr:hypothetical protein ADUPG1_000593 [Aduncisulcus paluster]
MSLADAVKAQSNYSLTCLFFLSWILPMICLFTIFPISLHGWRDNDPDSSGYIPKLVLGTVIFGFFALSFVLFIPFSIWGCCNKKSLFSTKKGYFFFFLMYGCAIIGWILGAIALPVSYVQFFGNAEADWSPNSTFRHWFFAFTYIWYFLFAILVLMQFETSWCALVVHYSEEGPFKDLLKSMMKIPLIKKISSIFTLKNPFDLYNLITLFNLMLSIIALMFGCMYFVEMSVDWDNALGWCGTYEYLVTSYETDLEVMFFLAIFWVFFSLASLCFNKFEYFTGPGAKTGTLLERKRAGVVMHALNLLFHLATDVVMYIAAFRLLDLISCECEHGVIAEWAKTSQQALLIIRYLWLAISYTCFSVIQVWLTILYSKSVWGEAEAAEHGNLLATEPEPEEEEVKPEDV